MPLRELEVMQGSCLSTTGEQVVGIFENSRGGGSSGERGAIAATSSAAGRAPLRVAAKTWRAGGLSRLRNTREQKNVLILFPAQNLS
jgi:hypothetical protein